MLFADGDRSSQYLLQKIPNRAFSPLFFLEGVTEKSPNPSAYNVKF